MRCCSRSRSISRTPTSRSRVRPAASAAQSSSDIAAAIHVTSVLAASSGESALTTPPAPRWAVRSPVSSRPNVYGPRWDTTITGRFPSSQLGVQPQPILELAGGQELPAHDLATGLAHLARAIGVPQQVGGVGRRGLDVVDEVAVHT